MKWGEKIGNTYSRHATLNLNEKTIPLVFIQHASKFYSWTNWSTFVKSKASSTINFLRKEVLGNGFNEEEKEVIQEVNDFRALEIPTWLTHKPIISSYYPAVSNDHNDDAIYLSAGRAQYNKEAMSIKLFRSNGDRWSRQSEELPVERVADFTLMLLASIKSYKNNEVGKTILNEQIIVNEDLGFIKDQIELNKERIKKSLMEIKRLMNDIDIDNF